jgi:predicted branched-subunit amino acid permease
MPAPALTAPARQSAQDFWIFWAGQTISNLGSSLTLFALPLLVFRLTGSALNLALSLAVTYLPALCFGLLIGVWVDRFNRKRLLLLTNLGSALVIGSIPLAAVGLEAESHVFVAWIYGTSFVSATLKLASDAGEFAALPSLVAPDALMRANSRLQASYAAAQTLGPLLAGAALFMLPLPTLFLGDAASFLVAAGALAAIRTRFQTETCEGPQRVLADIGAGLRYVWHQPVLRAISLMTPLLNVITTTTTAQLVLLAVTAYHANGQQVSLFYTAGSLGIVLCAPLAGLLRRRWSFSQVTLGAIFVMGGLLLALGLTPWLGLAWLLWGLSQGAEMVFNIQTKSLRQAIVPTSLLGRVMSVAMVLAYSSIPIGAVGGGLLIQWVGSAQITRVFAAIGLLIVLVTLLCSRTALGHAERYHQEAGVQPTPQAPSLWPAFRACFAGMRAMVPLAVVNILPLVVYGVTALKAGLSPLAAQALAISVFSGAILPAAQALQSGTPLLVVFLLIVLLNVRHLLYSAKLAPRLRRLPLPQRLLAGYVLADETVGALEQREQVEHAEDHRWPFLIGAGLMLWLVVQGAVALGLALGGRLPAWDGMSLLPTLAFLGLTVLNLKGRSSVVVAGTAGAAALALSGLPLNLGLLVAVGLGLGAGQIVKRWQRQPHLGWVKEGA